VAGAVPADRAGLSEVRQRPPDDRGGADAAHLFSAPVAPESQTMREIPRSKFARIRGLVKYGMTVSQVAKVYGVAVDKIERILRRP
jgi:hypothetical protein